MRLATGPCTSCPAIVSTLRLSCGSRSQQAHIVAFVEVLHHLCQDLILAREHDIQLVWQPQPGCRSTWNT